jgi:allantoin racemase
LVRKYNLQASLASVRAPDEGVEDLSDEDRYFQMGRAAIDEDLAEVLVLGCAGLAGLDKRLQERLGVPVLDGVVCALVVAEGLVRYEVSTSKVRRYRG